MTQVNNDENKGYLINLLASFCEQLPSDAEMEDGSFYILQIKFAQIVTYQHLNHEHNKQVLILLANQYDFAPLPTEPFWEAALTWASITFNLNPQLKSEAEHKAAQSNRSPGRVRTKACREYICASRNLVWECSICKFGVNTFDEWKITKPLILDLCWLSAPPISLLEAWASMESGVQRAMASYCMLRFQKAEGTRSRPQSYISLVGWWLFPLLQCLRTNICQWSLAFISTFNPGVATKGWSKSKMLSKQGSRPWYVEFKLLNLNSNWYYFLIWNLRVCYVWSGGHWYVDGRRQEKSYPR